MEVKLNRKLCVLAAICCFSLAPVFADTQSSSDFLKGSVHESESVDAAPQYDMTNLTPEYISDIEASLDQRIDETTALAGRYRIDENTFNAAKNMADAYIQMTEQYYGAKSAKTAQAYTKRARIYKNLIMPDKAFSDLKKAESIAKKTSNKEIKAEIYNEITDLYSVIGQPEDAAAYAEKIIAEKLYADNASLAGEYVRNGNLYAQAGILNKSADYFRKALKGYDEMPALDKYGKAAAYSGLLSVVNPKEEERLVEEFSKFAESLPADDMPIKISARLAKLRYYNEMNRITEQKKLLDETAKIISKNPNPYETMAISEYYMSYYNQMNNPAMVKKYSDIIKSFTYTDFAWDTLPKDSLLILSKYSMDIAENYGNLEEAQKAADAALNKIEPVKKYVPVRHAQFLLDGARINIAKGDFDKSKKYLKAARKALKKADTEPRYEEAGLYDVYSDYYLSKNDSEKAIKYADKAAGLYTELKGDTSFEATGINLRKAYMYDKLGMKDEAARETETMIEKVKEKYGADNVWSYEAMYNASYLYRNFDEKKADEIYKETAAALVNGRISGVSPMLFYGVYITEAERALSAGNNQNAVKYAEKASRYAYSTQDKQGAYRILSEAYEKMGRKSLSAKYKKLSGSV